VFRIEDMTSEAGMAIGETMTSRVDTGGSRIGDHVGTGTVEIKPGSDREAEFAALTAENLTLKNRIAELEAALASA
jgi:hypothetical protein